jgi:hypothetical protein
MRAMTGTSPTFGSESNSQDSSDAKVAAVHAGNAAPDAGLQAAAPALVRSQREVGGREGPEPTRFGDWEKSGRCIDF